MTARSGHCSTIGWKSGKRKLNLTARRDMTLPDTPLVSGDWLAARLDQPDIVIVDTRKGDGYAERTCSRARGASRSTRFCTAPDG